MPYAIRLTAEARRDFGRLDRGTADRIAARLEWLSNNLDAAATKALKGRFEGAVRFRVGDYRIIFMANHPEQVLEVLRVAHRSDAYRSR